MSNLNQFSSVIKSIQDGSVSITNDTAVAATITSVVVAKSVIVMRGATFATSGSPAPAYALTITNSTTVTLTMIAVNSALVAHFSVVEFY